MRLLSALVVLLAALFVAAPSALADDKTYQNDSIAPGGSGNVQAGFVQNEIAASVFTAPPADGPIFLQKARVLFFNALGQTTMRKMRILVYPSGSVNPGAPIYTSPIFTFIPGGENLVDLSVANIKFPAGQTFTIGARFEEAGLFVNFSSVVTDTNGITPGKNRIFDISSGTWKTAESVGITGDFGIRVSATIHGPVTYGTATPGINGTPTVDTTGAWKVGNPSFGLKGTAAPSSSTCFLGISEGTFNFPILGITFWIDPATTISLQAPTTATGAWTLNTPVPAVLALIGQHFYVQAFFADPGGPQGLSATAGLDITIDSAL